MILHCNYEELQALSRGTELLLTAPCTSGDPRAASSTRGDDLEALLPQLAGDLSIVTLAEQRRLRDAVAEVTDNLKACMDQKVIETYPAHEEALDLYFDYAHSRAVLQRVEALGEEMTAMVELMTGNAASEPALQIRFPD